MKNFIENILIWCLTRLNPLRVRSIAIDDRKIVVGISGYVKDDGQWHSIQATIAANIRVFKRDHKVVQYDDIAIYDGGRLVAKHKLNNPVKKVSKK